MIEGRRVFALILAVALTVSLGACGNSLEGGSEPSGSVLRVSGEVTSSALQDLFFCPGAAVEYATISFTVSNQDRPNFEDNPVTADGTASFVTLDRYTIKYTPLNMSGSIPGTEGAFTAGIEPGGTANISIPIFTEPVLEYIRSNFPAVGNGEAMDVRVDITYWGEDAFQVDVNVKVSTSVTVDDFNPCSSDLPPADESS
jgi:hypothetical protein